MTSTLLSPPLSQNDYFQVEVLRFQRCLPIFVLKKSNFIRIPSFDTFDGIHILKHFFQKFNSCFWIAYLNILEHLTRLWMRLDWIRVWVICWLFTMAIVITSIWYHEWNWIDCSYIVVSTSVRLETLHFVRRKFWNNGITLFQFLSFGWTVFDLGCRSHN